MVVAPATGKVFNQNQKTLLIKRKQTSACIHPLLLLRVVASFFLGRGLFGCRASLVLWEVLKLRAEQPAGGKQLR
jgi:hypothetical protein